MQKKGFKIFQKTGSKQFMSQNVQGEYRTAIDSNWFATESCIHLIYACPEMTIAQFVMPKMSKVKYDLLCKKKMWPEFYTRG